MEKQRTKINSVNFTYKRIVYIFILAAILLVCLILYFSLARAKIYVDVKSQPANIDFDVQVRENIEDNNYLETKILQGRILELTMEKTQSFEVIGQEEEAEKYAGMMTVYNNKSEEQALIPRTRFESSDGSIFRMYENLIIPAKSSAQVEVIAEEAGEEYKELPGRFILPGFKHEYQRQNVYGETKSTMMKKKVIFYELSQVDLEKAQSEIISSLKLDALNKFNELLVENEKIDEFSIITELISAEADKKPGEETENFEYTVKLKLIGVIFDHNELLNLAQTFLANQLNDSQDLINYDDDSLNYIISNYVNAEKSATLDVNFSAQVIQGSEAEVFNKERFKGLSQSEIIDYFNKIPAINSVGVTFSPFWVKKAPKLSDHIEIIISNR